MLNEVKLIGHLGKKPEIRAMSNGKEMVNLSVATSESHKDKDGQWQKKTQWHNLVSFNEFIVKKCSQLDKGSLVYASGKLATRKWQDPSGADRYTTEIICDTLKPLDKKEPSQSQAANGYQPDSQPLGDDTEIPF